MVVVYKTMRINGNCDNSKTAKQSRMICCVAARTDNKNFVKGIADRY